MSFYVHVCTSLLRKLEFASRRSRVPEKNIGVLREIVFWQEMATCLGAGLSLQRSFSMVALQTESVLTWLAYFL